MQANSLLWPLNSLALLFAPTRPVMNTEGRQGNVRALMGNCDVIAKKGQEEGGGREGIQYDGVSIESYRYYGIRLRAACPHCIP